ncbi:MAG: transglycosylase domain-containing protein [Eubacteriales bacterium]|nr:transglycosylase domain-containing protein [Eubacteriales bacterium]
MKYGRKDIEKKLKNTTAVKIEHKAGMTLMRLLVVGIFTVIVGTASTGYGIIEGLIKSAPDISSLSTAPTEAATYIYDTGGNQIQKLTAPTSNRTPISISQIPLDMQHAIVAIEDERFYQHNGIDVRGIIRAFAVGVRGGSFSEGASTITQQLLKNSVFTDWVSESSLTESLKRKFQEQYLAIELEQELEKNASKEDVKAKILEDYMNMINLGAGTYGVQAAAQRYFNKNVSDLTLSECTVIAGITQNPTGYNPITHPEANALRRQRVLDKMLEQGYISKASYDEALADDVYTRIAQTDTQTGETTVYSYYTDAMIEQIMEDLIKTYGYTSTQAYHALYSGGLRIYSVQDPYIQQICDEEFANPDNYPSETLLGLDYALTVQTAAGETINYGSVDVQEYFETNDPSFHMMFYDEDTLNSYAADFKASVVHDGDTVLGERISVIPQPQASCVIIEQSTGYVKAIVGGRGTKEASLTLNRATASRRQPGSTFKPIAAYAPALEMGGKTLGTVYDNAPYTYNSGTELRNWDSDYGYSGLETIHSAIIKSINVVAVKVLTEITPQVGLNYLEQLGISTLYNSDLDANGNIITDAYQPLALGGVTDGVVNLELTAAYAALANSGTYITPKFYSRVEDSQGNILLENTVVSREVFSPQTAFLITKAMEDVVRDPNGTANGYIDLGDLPVSGKTGTTDNSKDIWFEGYTPYYTCGIWGGYDSNEPLPDSDRSYSTYAKTLWNSIMTRVHSDLPAVSFTQPEGITTAVICKKSGKLAVSGLCDADPRGSQIITEYYREGTQPTESCNVHQLVSICTQTQLLATASCPSVQKICIRRPEGSTDTTDDSNYAAPTATCSGHAQKPTEKETESETESETPAVLNDDGVLILPGQEEDQNVVDPSLSDPSANNSNEDHPEAPPADNGDYQFNEQYYNWDDSQQNYYQDNTYVEPQAQNEDGTITLW